MLISFSFQDQAISWSQVGHLLQEDLHFRLIHYVFKNMLSIYYDRIQTLQLHQRRLSSATGHSCAPAPWMCSKTNSFLCLSRNLFFICSSKPSKDWNKSTLLGADNHRITFESIERAANAFKPLPWIWFFLFWFCLGSAIVNSYQFWYHNWLSVRPVNETYTKRFQSNFNTNFSI